MKRFFDDTGDVVDIGDQIAVFDHRQRHAIDVGFLEGAFADHRLGHLACNSHQRHRIHVGIGDAGDQVGRSGPLVAMQTPARPVTRP